MWACTAGSKGPRLPCSTSTASAVHTSATSANSAASAAASTAKPDMNDVPLMRARASLGCSSTRCRPCTARAAAAVVRRPA